jgi:hypothetical protein
MFLIFSSPYSTRFPWRNENPIAASLDKSQSSFLFPSSRSKKSEKLPSVADSEIKKLGEQCASQPAALPHRTPVLRTAHRCARGSCEHERQLADCRRSNEEQMSRVEAAAEPAAGIDRRFLTTEAGSLASPLLGTSQSCTWPLLDTHAASRSSFSAMASGTLLVYDFS